MRALAADDRNGLAAYTWLTRSAGRKLLDRISKGELALTHEALDGDGRSTAAEHLRFLLQQVGALEARDKNLASAARRVDQLIDRLADRDDRTLLRSYATWEALNRLRFRSGREGGAQAGAAQATVSHVRTLQRFVEQLRSTGKSVASANQRDVDRWLAKRPDDATSLKTFFRWLSKYDGSINVSIPATQKSTPAVSMGDEERWEFVLRALRDDDLPIETRVVSLLVLIYAQPVTRIARLRQSDVRQEGGTVTVLLGSEPLEVVDPLGSLLLQLPDPRQLGLSNIAHGNSPWLFPGRNAGDHANAATLRSRLRELGIHSGGELRKSAIADLARQVPSPVLADLLGFHINTAATWAQASGGNYARYAALRLAGRS